MATKATGRKRSRRLLNNDLLSLWQRDYDLMKCQDCPSNNRTKATSHLTFYTFQCEHFNFVCGNCATNAVCKAATSEHGVCGARRLTFKTPQGPGRFPQRPWLSKEGQVLNDHRNEVLQSMNKPLVEFNSLTEYEGYDAARAELAHNLNADDSNVVSQAVEKLRATDAPAAVKVRRTKMFATKLDEAQVQLANARQDYIARVEEESEKQLRWLKRQQPGKHRVDHDYSIFALSENQSKAKKGGWSWGQSMEGVGLSSVKGNRRNTSQFSAAAIDKLPEKPKRKYNFEENQGAKLETLPDDGFRAVGFNKNWVYERFMADIEGNWD